MRLIPILFILALPFAAQAAPSLPATLLKSIKADPSSYLDSVAALIASYGAADGITEEQVATSMALVRAKARTAAEVPLMRADLDGDGKVSRAEIVVVQSAASAATRGKLEKIFIAADTNGDAVVSLEERTELGALAAMAAYSPAQMAQMKVLMGFDGDADGKVTVNEVRQALAGLVS